MINACYGGLMSKRANHLGAAGTVIDGRLRDLQEHRDLEYPVSKLLEEQPLELDEVHLLTPFGRSSPEMLEQLLHRRLFA